MLKGRDTIVLLIAGQIKKNVNVELDLFNYATKTDLKNAIGADTSSFTKNADLANSCR